MRGRVLAVPLRSKSAGPIIHKSFTLIFKITRYTDLRTAFYRLAGAEHFSAYDFSLFFFKYIFYDFFRFSFQTETDFTSPLFHKTLVCPRALHTNTITRADTSTHANPLKGEQHDGQFVCTTKEIRAHTEKKKVVLKNEEFSSCGKLGSGPLDATNYFCCIFGYFNCLSDGEQNRGPDLSNGAPVDGIATTFLLYTDTPLTGREPNPHFTNFLTWILFRSPYWNCSAIVRLSGRERAAFLYFGPTRHIFAQCFGPPNCTQNICENCGKFIENEWNYCFVHQLYTRNNHCWLWTHIFMSK